jgi:hypothetical protein
MKKFWLGLVLLFCFAVPYAAQAQVVVVVHPIIIIATIITTQSQPVIHPS